MSERRGEELEERLIAFAVRVIRVGEALPKSEAGKHIAGQLVRSGSSPAANYAEAQEAESRADFVHKLKVCVKELRETMVWLRISCESNFVKPKGKLKPLIEENNELIAIFVKSIQTAKKSGGKQERE